MIKKKKEEIKIPIEFDFNTNKNIIINKEEQEKIIQKINEGGIVITNQPHHNKSNMYNIYNIDVRYILGTVKNIDENNMLTVEGFSENTDKLQKLLDNNYVPRMRYVGTVDNSLHQKKEMRDIKIISFDMINKEKEGY